jgi:ABC-type uncharacterized transport system substrate-binding protein
MRVIGLAVVLVLSVTVAPLTAEAQPTPARLAVLLTGPPATATPEYAAFMKQLADLGWIDGQNLAVDRRWADAPEKFIGLAADAVRAKPTVILAAGPDATRAAQQATSAVPIVMIASTDPRVLGVASLAHPGGNLTGLTIGQPEVTSEKRLELVKEALPSLARVAVLWDVKRSADSGASVETPPLWASSSGSRRSPASLAARWPAGPAPHPSLPGDDWRERVNDRGRMAGLGHVLQHSVGPLELAAPLAVRVLSC